MNIELKKTLRGWQAILTLMLVFVLASCGGKESEGNQSMISGGSSKTWKSSKELTASGEKDKLSSEEKQETMQFYSDGRFALGGGDALQTGTWSYDQAAKKLSLTFEGQDVAETFDVTSLSEKEMHLKAADGSEMHMKAE
ncbi:lipocalin family protein [Pontibacter vulgaris]|uniref:lipocalin family protein n=1 Tax=Pontibacter vulgaris TaxID=2905679 RepID=UPI001FA78366|nr:lipocalin family protein [Pontibacter vulgaris]